MKCAYCGKEIKPDDPKVPDDYGEEGDYLHLSCAIAISDGDVIEADMD